jgi:hypothetical protein
MQMMEDALCLELRAGVLQSVHYYLRSVTTEPYSVLAKGAVRRVAC